MPELPEVETPRRGIAPHLVGRRIEALTVRNRALRWPVSRALPGRVRGQRVEGVRRRAKYLLIGTEPGELIVHLGMTGSLRVRPAGDAGDAYVRAWWNLDGPAGEALSGTATASTNAATSDSASLS